MPKPEIPVVQRSIFWWVRQSSKKLQAALLISILLAVFARVFPLEMQKRIVNEAIRFRNLDLLAIYCSLFLVAVVISSGLKYLINLLQATLGEQALAALRQALYAHIITIPLPFFRKTQPGMVVSALVTEIAGTGEFVGSAVAVPVTNILTLLAFAAYLFWLNPLLALLSMSIYPVSILAIPRLQARVNRLNKERVDTTRDLSSLIGEAIAGIHEIHGHGSYALENRKFSRIVQRLYRVRLRWNLGKYAVKVVNNFFVSFGPLVVFVVGGYLTIRGRLDLGALVAFLSAQEKLYDPVKELISFYQTYQDATVRYRRTLEYFDVMPDHPLEPEGRDPYELQGRIEAINLSYEAEGGIRLLDGINLSVEPGEQLALVGFSGSGKSTLALCMAQLYTYTSGQLLIDGKDVATLSKKDIVANLGLVSQQPFIFQGSIRENLLYSCQAARGEDSDSPTACGADLDQIIEVLQQTGIFVDVLGFGLNSFLDEQRHRDLAGRLVEVRYGFQQQFGKALADYVEFFAEGKYMHYGSIAENLLFGTVADPSFRGDNLSRNPYFLAFLAEAGLTAPLLDLGTHLATRVVEVLGTLAPDEVFFRHSPVAANEITTIQGLVTRLQRSGLDSLASGDRTRLLEIALRFIPGKHKLVGLPPGLEEKVLAERTRLRDRLQRDRPGVVRPYEIDAYLYDRTILENILFGKVTTDNPTAQGKINHGIMQLLIEADLLETVVDLGLDYNVGTKGDRLSGGQRQKLAIARVFLKEPRILLMDEATSALDNRSQERIQRILQTKWKGRSTLIAVAHRLDTIKEFDKIAVLKGGKVMELGTYEELVSRGGIMYELVHGRT